MSKIRHIERTRYDVEVTEVQLPPDLRGWLAKQMEQATLLAHADDGLIWGRVDNGYLSLAHDLFPDISPLLREETLWQLWLFNPDQEVFIWRDGSRWLRRLIRERTGDEQEYYDETQMLWGLYVRETRAGFILVQEGQDWLLHAVPLTTSKAAFDGKRHPLRLRVRHYLTTDETSGLLRVALSRLVERYIEEVQQ